MTKSKQSVGMINVCLSGQPIWFGGLATILAFWCYQLLAIDAIHCFPFPYNSHIGYGSSGIGGFGGAILPAFGMSGMGGGYGSFGFGAGLSGSLAGGLYGGGGHYGSHLLHQGAGAMAMNIYKHRKLHHYDEVNAQNSIGGSGSVFANGASGGQYGTLGGGMLGLGGALGGGLGAGYGRKRK